MTVAESPSQMAPQWLQSPPLQRGQSLGRFIILERLGSGGCAVVYSAFDPELDRRVAIKVLRSDLGPARSGGAPGLILEARAMARLSHPNVVTVYEVGEHEGGVFIAMELMLGATLADWIRAEQPPWQGVRDALFAAGTGLAAAHDEGIVHRDFKPRNVLRGADGRVAVADFGLARDFGDGGRPVEHPDLDLERPYLADTGSTESGGSVLMGTPVYMAPEVMNGSVSDERADQFSFCVSLYEGLYGVRPFRGESLGELHAAMRKGKLVPPKRHRTVPGWLRKTVLRGLTAEPIGRHPSMAALLSSLQHDRRSRRRTVAVVALVAVVSVGGTAAASVWLRSPPTAEQRAQIDQLTERARAAAARGYFVHGPQGDPPGRSALAVVRELETLEGASKRDGTDRGAELRGEFTATLLRIGDEYWARDGGRPFAADYYAAALVFDPGNNHATGRTSWSPAQVEELRGRLAANRLSAGELAVFETLAALSESTDEARTARLAGLTAGPRAPSVMISQRLRSMLGPPRTEATGSVTPPELPSGTVSPRPNPAKTTTAVATVPAVAAKTTAVAEVKAGRAALKAGRNKEAEAAFHRALRADKRHAGALAGLAEVYFEAGTYARALEFANKAVARRPRAGAYRLLLGDIHFRVLSYAAAQAQYDKAAELGHPAAAARLRRLVERTGG